MGIFRRFKRIESGNKGEGDTLPYIQANLVLV